MKLGMGNSLTGGYMTRIMTGGLMGLLMWANVWFIIWPAQKVVIANANNVAGGGEPDPTAAGRGQRAGLASRTNTLFSIPMLFFMGSASHFTSLASGLLPGGSASLGLYWIVALALILAVEVNGLIGPGASSQKMLTTVKGTIHGGLVLTLLLYITASVLL
jgi:uncharacterized membrane protein